MNAAAAIVAPLGSPGSANGILSTVLSPVKSALGGLAGLGLSAVVSWVIDGARAALLETAHIIGVTTAPQLSSSWFGSTYWKVAGLAALLTVPFLCAAAVQAVLSSSLATLIQAALFHLPVAIIGVTLTAPVVMLLLAATDQMCSVVSGAGIGGGANFLAQAAEATGSLTAINGSPFFAVIVALFTAAAAIALTIEMLVREAAVYVVVLMLPLVFAALVWPARRIWAVRLLELLVGLILSKFAIVAVLSLAGAAYGSSGGPGASRVLTAMSLVLLSTFAPWAMLRLLPFAELAAGAAGSLSGHAHRIADRVEQLPQRVAEMDALLGGLGGSGPGAGRQADDSLDLSSPEPDLADDGLEPTAPESGGGTADGGAGDAALAQPSAPAAATPAPGGSPPFVRLGSRTHEMGPEWEVPEVEPSAWLGPRPGGGAATNRKGARKADRQPGGDGER
jgi:hypothetical protein